MFIPRLSFSARQTLAASVLLLVSYCCSCEFPGKGGTRGGGGGGGGGSRGDEICLNLTASPTLEKFVDALPTMPIILLSRNPRITIGAYKITQKLHRDLPPTTLYAFGTSQATAVYPGPTLIAQQGIASYVRWENHIPDKEYMLPVDRTIDWANPRLGYVPMVVHNHGQEDPGWSDGHPEAWFTILGEHGPTYVTQEYYYPNDQNPTTLWYHDHTVGTTRLGIAAGLAGVYIVESETMTPDWVPREYHTLLVQDKAFYEDGEIKYPTVGINPDVHPQWCPDYFGDVVLVNGKAWPYLHVSPTVNRFRIVNAANSRFFVFTLRDSRLSFIKIGTDVAFLRTPIQQRTLRLGPAERADVLIDFSACAMGEEIELHNIGSAPFSDGTPANQSVLLFKVILPRHSHQAPARLPTPLTPNDIERMSPAEVAFETSGVKLLPESWERLYNRPFVIDAQVDSGGGLVALFLQDRLQFDDPPTEILKIGTNEVWTFINSVAVTHPIHLHLVNFIVVARQRLNTTRFINGTCSFHYRYPDYRSCYDGPIETPDQDQVGFKDTAAVLGEYVTWFYVTSLAHYAFDPTDFPGYVWHCHLLEHEDNVMMRPLLMTKGESSKPNASFPEPMIYRKA